SENLKIRFSQYFNVNYLKRNNNLYICRALLKHDYSNFSLEILEYCEPDKCLIREKHYLDIYQPEYNISLDPAAPFSGRTHSDETKKIISNALTGEKNPMFGITGENHPRFGQNHTEESKQIMSDVKKGENHPMYGKNHSDKTKQIISDALKGRPKNEGAGRPSQQIEVFDNKNNTTTS